MITEGQHDFLKERSTATNIFCVTQNIAKALEKRKPLSFWCDIYRISKAFDKLIHEILISIYDRFGSGVFVLI